MIQAERNHRIRSTGRGGDSPACIIAAGLAAIIGTVCTIDTASAQLSTTTASTVTEQLFDTVNSSVCTISAIASDGSYLSRGTGFVLKDSGLIVTNAHVVAGLKKATAKCGGQQLNIRRIVKFDRTSTLLWARSVLWTFRAWNCRRVGISGPDHRFTSSAVRTDSRAQLRRDWQAANA